MLDNKNHMHMRNAVRLSACMGIPQTRQQKRVRILVVNGHGRGGKLLQDILISGGYEVEALSDGSEGVELCKKNNFTLAFIDLEISGLSAWQLSEEIKKINQDIPVILVTGWKAQPDDSALQKSQFDCVVNKPFSFNQVLKLVKELTSEV